MSESSDLARLRKEFADREKRLATSNIYSYSNRGNRFIIQQRHRAVLALLRHQGVEALRDLRILEIGCGRGEVLQEYIAYGATQRYLHGTELLADRVRTARARLPYLPLTCADGQNLPYAEGVFDMVLQYTVFTSILDDSIKANLAREMLRVLRKPEGLIVWYDFWLNPTNPQTRGIRPAEIRRLFPGCQFGFQRITLAPPLSRKLIRCSRHLCYFLEKIRLLNTHYLVAIRAESKNNN